MSLTSLYFILFVFVSVLVYYIVPQHFRWISLLASSIIFYISYSPWGLIALAASSLYTFGATALIQKSKNTVNLWIQSNKDSSTKEERKFVKKKHEKQQSLIVVSVIILNIFVLFFCKYLNPMLNGISGVLNVDLWKPENILLPLGISYYSLSLIGYAVDVKRDIVTAEKNPLKVLLFSSFFLSIMQGPFCRYNDLVTQINSGGNSKKLTGEKFKSACIRILAGYVKKMCIADQVAIISNEIFSNYENYGGLGNLLGIICFSVQLYADFAGYMDIICGIGELFGISIPENFKQPFFSRTISEFWQKWHITLGLWLKDYVFYPILKSKAWKKLGKKTVQKFGKNLGRNIPTYLGMVILWTFIGLWHGSGLKYVFSVGILQFCYIFIGEITEPITTRIKHQLKIKETSLGFHIFQSVKCTLLMMFAWIFFNSKSLSDAVQFIKGLFSKELFSFSSILAPFFNEKNEALYVGNHGIGWLLYILASIVLLLVIDLLHENGIHIRDTLAKQKYPVRLAVYLSLIFLIIIFGAYGSQYDASNFIYFEF